MTIIPDVYLFVATLTAGGAMLDRTLFVIANILVMIVLHGNSRQWWPKIPYLSLRDESVGEHVRLLFNTLLLVTLGQLALQRLPAERRLPRLAVLLAIPGALPALIWFGQRVLQLQGKQAEAYNLSMAPLLPIVAVFLEDALAGLQRPQE
jgi:hypothetical protein